jgi:hypothetical protein
VTGGGARDFVRDLGEDPDEYRHAAIGRRALALQADTPARQSAARAACREMNERVAGASAAPRARVDRGA